MIPLSIIAILLLAFKNNTYLSGVDASGTFTLVNNCPYTVWPAIVSYAGTAPPNLITGFALQQGKFNVIQLPLGWYGRIWARTHCSTNSTGNFKCITGDCGTGKIECEERTPFSATMVEVSLAHTVTQLDDYGVSLTYGYNLPVLIVPQDMSGGNCSTTGCAVDLNGACPTKFKVTDEGKVVACISTCMEFYLECIGDTQAELLESLCPRASSYCAGADYIITFCPSSATRMSNLQFVLDTKLDETNFLDWEINLKIVLRHEKIGYVLDTPFPEKPGDDASEIDKERYNKHCSDSVDATCLMFAFMTLELQKQHEHLDAYDIMVHLKDLYASQSRTERYEVSKALFNCKMAAGVPVGSHVLKMIGYIERLEKLVIRMEHELSIDLILQSLPDSFSQFVMNYYMNMLDSTLAELLNMLKTTEGTVPKGKKVMLVTSSKKKKTRSSKKKGKALKAKPKIAKDKTEDACFFCDKKGHWN